jgi:hypothetical protein
LAKTTEDRLFFLQKKDSTFSVDEIRWIFEAANYKYDLVGITSETITYKAYELLGLTFDFVAGTTYRFDFRRNYVGIANIEGLQENLDLTASEIEVLKNATKSEANELIEKGFNHIENFDWYVFAQKYRWNGVLYEAPEDLVIDTVTIDPAPTTVDFKRFDVIVFNDDFTFSKVKGDEGLNPAIPKIDIRTQIQLTVILVEYGTTEPSYLTKQLMYDEGVGLPTEFAVTKTGTSIEIDNIEQSSSGTKSIKVTNPVNSDVLFLDKNATFNSLDTDTISFKIKNGQKSNASFYLYSYNSIGAFYQGTTEIKNGKYGYNSQNITDWQIIIVPRSKILGGSEIHNTGWALTFKPTTGTYYFDEFAMNGNFTQAPVVSGHTHDNLSVLEQITQTLFNTWNTAYNWVTTNGANVLAHLANKQNSLATDGTGEKYPTVDAVNEGLATKLDASAYNQHFKGKFTTSAALIAAYPTATDGDYAIVDAGAGVDAKEWIWDTEAGWIVSSAAAAGTTDSLTEGSTNLYFTASRVLATILTGISFITGTAVVTTDSILVAFGKLQKQITDLISGKQNALTAGTNITIDNTDPLNPVINAAGGGSINPPVHLKYTTQALMIADQANQVSGYIYFDATYYYEYLGTVLGTIEDYRIVSGINNMYANTDQTVSGIKTFLASKFGLRNTANTFTSFFASAVTASRIWTFPDKAGTVAMTSDIVAQLNGVVNYLVKFGTATTGVVSRLWDTGTFFGIGTVNTPTKDITLGNQGNREIGVELSNSENTGKDLIISAGKTINYILNNTFVLTIIQNIRLMSIQTLANGDVWATDRYNTGRIVKMVLGNDIFVDAGYGSYSNIGCLLIHPITNDLYWSQYGANGYRYQVNSIGEITTVHTEIGVEPYFNYYAPTNSIYATVDSGKIMKQTNSTGLFVELVQPIVRTFKRILCHSNGNVYATTTLSVNGLFVQYGGEGDFIQLTIPYNVTYITENKTNGDILLVNGSNVIVQRNATGAFSILDTVAGTHEAIGVTLNGTILLPTTASGVHTLQSDGLGTADLDGGTLINKAGTGKGTGKSRYQIITGQKTVSGTDMQLETLRIEVDEDGNYKRIGTPIYADNASALAGGLTAGMEYRTATGIKMEVY